VIDIAVLCPSLHTWFPKFSVIIKKFLSSIQCSAARLFPCWCLNSLHAGIKKNARKTRYSRIYKAKTKKRFEHIELPSKLLNYSYEVIRATSINIQHQSPCCWNCVKNENDAQSLDFWYYVPRLIHLQRRSDLHVHDALGLRRYVNHVFPTRHVLLLVIYRYHPGVTIFSFKSDAWTRIVQAIYEHARMHVLSPSHCVDYLFRKRNVVARIDTYDVTNRVWRVSRWVPAGFRFHVALHLK